MLLNQYMFTPVIPDVSTNAPSFITVDSSDAYRRYSINKLLTITTVATPGEDVFVNNIMSIGSTQKDNYGQYSNIKIDILSIGSTQTNEFGEYTDMQIKILSIGSVYEPVPYFLLINSTAT